MKELAHKYNVSLSTLYNIKNNRHKLYGGVSRRKFVEIDEADQMKLIVDLLII